MVSCLVEACGTVGLSRPKNIVIYIQVVGFEIVYFLASSGI